jgi:Pyruvate/2-oxoacid:ferredoxin oxidoreductase delta subunit
MNKLPAMLLMMLSLAGCRFGTDSPALKTEAISNARFCVVYSPVYTAKADTEQTKQQVDENNAKWVRLCDKVTK